MPDDAKHIERHLIEMFTLAGEYCIKIENAEQFSKDEIFTFLHKISPLLYLRGLLFPITEEPEEEGDERIVTEEQWENVFNTLRNKFGTDDNFNYLDFATPENIDPIKGSLAELFSDVYQDMKDFAWLMTKNSLVATKHAAYDIRKLFVANWGAKLLLAQLVMHSRLITENAEEDYADLD